MIVILEGESLFNDASALLIYRAAVATALTGSFSGSTALLLLAASSLGSVLRRFDADTGAASNAAADGAHLTRRALEAERRVLSDLRARGTIGDDAFHRVEEELD